MIQCLNFSMTLAGSSPGRRGRHVGSCSLEARLLGQQTGVQVGEKMFQLFQVLAVFERFFFQRHGCFRMLRHAPQGFRSPHQLAEYVGEVLGPDGRTVFPFRTETKQRGTQIIIHLAQGFERVQRHYPFQSICTASVSVSVAPEATGRTVLVLATDGFSTRSTWIHASRNASKSVITWLTARFEGWNCTHTTFWRRAL